MADHKRFKVPLPTRHSFGIEIECLVAWLPPKRKDPYESEVQGLPPVLRVESGQSPLQNHIRDLLTANGVPVIDPREDDSASEVSASGEPSLKDSRARTSGSSVGILVLQKNS